MEGRNDPSDVGSCEALKPSSSLGAAGANTTAHPERSEQEYFERNTRLGCILFVGNLPFQTPWQHVKDHFQEAGKVRYTDLIADNEGRPKGSALVTMESPEGALRAIEMFNEQLFEGRRLIVRLLEAGRRPPLVQKERMPVYGRGRGGAHAGETLPSRGGYYAEASVQHTPFSGRGRGGQQSNFATSKFEGIPKPRSQQFADIENCAGRRLNVSNLPFNCTDAALYDTFRQVGTVLRAEIRLRHGRSTGVGTVIMATEEEACTAIAEFDGIEMAGRAMRVCLEH